MYMYADMTIYAIDPATLGTKMCHHKLPTTIVPLLTLSNVWYIIFSSLETESSSCTANGCKMDHESIYYSL